MHVKSVRARMWGYFTLDGSVVIGKYFPFYNTTLCIRFSYYSMIGVVYEMIDSQ